MVLRLSKFSLCFLMLLFAGNVSAKEKIVAVSYVSTPFNLQMILMKQLGLLEREFSKHHAEVEWVEDNRLTDQMGAVSEGTLDIASSVSAVSMLMALDDNPTAKIILNVARPQYVMALVTRAEFQGEVCSLKAKRVAGPTSSVFEHMLVAQLNKVGLNDSDVDLVAMPEEQALIALMNSEVDAALLSAANLAKAKSLGARVLSCSKGRFNPMQLSVTSSEFAQEHAELIDAYITAHKKAMTFILQHEPVALAIGAKEQGISVEQATLLYRSSGLATGFNSVDKTLLRNDQKFLLQHDLIKQQVDLSSLFLESTPRGDEF